MHRSNPPNRLTHKDKASERRGTATHPRTWDHHPHNHPSSRRLIYTTPTHRHPELVSGSVRGEGQEKARGEMLKQVQHDIWSHLLFLHPFWGAPIQYLCLPFGAICVNKKPRTLHADVPTPSQLTAHDSLPKNLFLLFFCRKIHKTVHKNAKNSPKNRLVHSCTIAPPILNTW